MSTDKLNVLATPALGLALEGPVRAKKGKTQDLKALAGKLQRIAKGAPEVLVKVRGGGTKGPGHILAHLTYITRNCKLEAFNERGEKVQGQEQVRQTFEQWGFSTAAASTRKRALAVNFVLSMPEGTDPDAVLKAAKGFAKDHFSHNHQYLLALHTDTERPHVHLSVKAQGFDMMWLRRNKEDLQAWRESFAQQLRDQGVEAEATPRRARGVVRKPSTQVMHHLQKTPTRSRVLKANVDEVLQELQGRGPSRPAPWEEAIAKRQEVIRSTYAAIERGLRQAPDPQAHVVADQLGAFLQKLPPLETQKALLKRQIAYAVLGRPRDQAEGGIER